MEMREFVMANSAEGLGLFDQECKDKEGKGYPVIDEQVLHRGKQTCKAIDMCGIQAHAGYYMIGAGGEEFEFKIDECPSLYLTMKAETGTDTCLLLVVHDKEPKDYMRRFVVIGKTLSVSHGRGVPVGKDYFTIKDDNKWHDYTYDLRKLRGDYPDAETVRIVQFYSGKLCNGIQHAFHFSSLVFKSNEVLVNRIAEEMLVSFKELPGFDNAIISGIHPIYDLGGKNIAYFEVKFTSPQSEDNGYAIISATEDDLPVVEFSHTGPTHFERFQDKQPGKKFKMIRFNAGYITAEDPRGKLLAEIGERPSVIPGELKVHARGEGSDHRAPTRKDLTPRINISQIRRRTDYLDYKTLKATYKHPKLRDSELRYHWKIAKSPHSPCTFIYHWADGYGQCTHFSQIPSNTPPNTNDHWSGCGPTAWMNLYGWHDRNWKASLLSGDQKYNNLYIKKLTMDLHDYLGTFEPWWTFGADQGFTWPSDMEKGLEFARGRLHHDCSYWYRHDWAFTDELWVFEVARDAARKKRPFIVGYYEDWHYTIGRGIAECSKHGWKKHSWIWLHPEDKWIPMGTIFGIYAVYNLFTMRKTTLPETSNYGPALVNGNGKILLSWTGKGNKKHNFMQSLDGLGFSGKVTLGDTSYRGLAVAYFKNRFFVAWTGTDRRHRLNVMQSADGRTWSNKITLNDTSESGLSLAIFKDRIYLAWRGKGNNKLNVMSSSDGIAWSNKVTLNDTTTSGPALASLGSYLFLAWRGVGNNKLNAIRSGNGTSFSNKVTLQETTKSRPALSNHNGKLYLSWQGVGNRKVNVLTSTNGSAWGGKITLSETCIDGPTLSTIGQDLIIGWTGTDSSHRLNARLERM